MYKDPVVGILFLYGRTLFKACEYPFAGCEQSSYIGQRKFIPYLKSFFSALRTLFLLMLFHGISAHSLRYIPSTDTGE